MIEQEERGPFLFENFLTREPSLVLITRSEELVPTPEAKMSRINAHIGLPDSLRFFTPFPRLHPERFF